MLEGGKSAEGCTAASAGIFWSLSLVNRPHAADSAEGQLNVASEQLAAGVFINSSCAFGPRESFCQ